MPQQTFKLNENQERVCNKLVKVVVMKKIKINVIQLKLGFQYIVYFPYLFDYNIKSFSKNHKGMLLFFYFIIISINFELHIFRLYTA